MRDVFISSDWETASIDEIKKHLSIIEALHDGGIIISSRLGNYAETKEYLETRIKEE